MKYSPTLDKLANPIIFRDAKIIDTLNNAILLPIDQNALQKN